MRAAELFPFQSEIPGRSAGAYIEAINSISRSMEGDTCRAPFIYSHTVISFTFISSAAFFTAADLSGRR